MGESRGKTRSCFPSCPSYTWTFPHPSRWVAWPTRVKERKGRQDNKARHNPNGLTLSYHSFSYSLSSAGYKAHSLNRISLLLRDLTPVVPLIIIMCSPLACGLQLLQPLGIHKLTSCLLSIGSVPNSRQSPTPAPIHPWPTLNPWEILLCPLLQQTLGMQVSFI